MVAITVLVMMCMISVNCLDLHPKVDNENDEAVTEMWEKEEEDDMNEALPHLRMNEKGLDVLEVNDEDVFKRKTKTPMEILIKDISKIKDDVDDIEKQNKNMKKQIQVINSQNMGIKSQNKEITKQNDEITKQNNEIKSQNKEIMKQNNEIKNQINEIKNQNKELKSQNKEITKQNKEIKSQNMEIKNQNKELKSQNKEIKKQDKEMLDLQNPVLAPHIKYYGAGYVRRYNTRELYYGISIQTCVLLCYNKRNQTTQNWNFACYYLQSQRCSCLTNASGFKLNSKFKAYKLV